MRKKISEKKVVVIALVVGILCLSIGFASFSTMLNINSTAHITPNSDTFKILFSEEKDIISIDPVVPTLTGGANGESAIINNDGNPKITKLNANFTKPGQTVTYSFYVANVGEYDAYLNEVKYLNIIGKEIYKLCSGEAGTSENLVQSACNDITVSIKVGTEDIVYNTSTFNNHKLLKDMYEPVVVTINYASNGTAVDGPMNIDFGDIELTYSTVNDKTNNVVPTPPTGTVINGLYTALDEPGRKIYRGENPDNYIWLDENGDSVKQDTELYRIISYENDGTTKVIRNTVLGNMPWDSIENGRNNDNNTYCKSSGTYNGCNAWGNQNNTYMNGNLLGDSFYYKYYKDNTTSTLSQNATNKTVTTDATLNKYLNNEWYNTLSIKDLIEIHKFNVGGPMYNSIYT